MAHGRLQHGQNYHLGLSSLCHVRVPRVPTTDRHVEIRGRVTKSPLFQKLSNIRRTLSLTLRDGECRLAFSKESARDVIEKRGTNLTSRAPTS